MEENKRAAGDILLELREAEELEGNEDDNHLMWYTEGSGGLFSHICC